MKPSWIDIIKWRELIGEAEKEAKRNYQFLSPITDEEIKEFEKKLEVEFPDELLSLYTTTNGIQELLGDQIIGNLIWSSDEVIERNLEMRNTLDFSDLYMPFDCLLFLADVGNGDLFGIPELNHKFPRLDIFLWNHEDDSRTWVASNLYQFVKAWILGNLKV